MKLRTALLFLCFDIIHDTQCEENTENTTEPLDYYEFRLKHGDPINYDEMVAKVVGRNKTKSYEDYGTDWHDFTDNTHLLINLPHEEDKNVTTTTSGNYWNIVGGAKFMTFKNDEWHMTSPLPGDETWTYMDLTDGLTVYANFTLAKEKEYNESLYRPAETTQKSTLETDVTLNIQDHTDNDIFFNADDDWLQKYVFNTSAEDRKLKLEDFLRYTVTTGPTTSTTWNPFLIQSDERRELDREAKERRMATNNMMRDQVKAGMGGMGGLGGLLGGLGGLGGVIPVNIGGLGGLMGGLRTVTIIMAGSTSPTTPPKSTTSPKSTVSRRTFKPRPDPQDFMKWKFLEDGSPRPPMDEDEFIRILKKHGTPAPYHIPPVSVPAGLGDDLLDMIPNENTTFPVTIEQEQLDRIHKFINPFIQQHTAMDLLNVNNVGRFTVPSSSTDIPYTGDPTTRHWETTTTPTTPRRTAQTGIFTTRSERQIDESWKQGWSHTYNTIDPFDKDNLARALNQGVHKDHPWRDITLKTIPTVVTDPDPRLAALERDFLAVNFKEEQAKRVSHAVEAKKEFDKEVSKHRERTRSKPPYWKEVIFKRPVEPLYEETSTAHNTAELQHLFSFLRGVTGTIRGHPLSTDQTRGAPTSANPNRGTATANPISIHNVYVYEHSALHDQPRPSNSHSMYWTFDEHNVPILSEAFRHRPSPHESARHEDTMTLQTVRRSSLRREETSTAEPRRSEKWTTPREDRERLQTLLSLMFPYIQKKSDIFGTFKGDERSSTTASTTDFDPWGSSFEAETPIMPELGKLFERLAVNSSHTFR